MILLPEDILNIIFKKYAIIFINPVICSKVHHYKKVFYKEQSSKIVRWYRYNSLSLYKLNEFEDNLYLLPKVKLIRFYILYYPIQYMIKFPEFIIWKCNLDSNLLNNLNEEKLRKKSEVVSFLKKSEITKNIICYAGW